MQQLLVQLLQQLHGSRVTDDQGLQRMMLFGCCNFLQSLHLQSDAAGHSVSPHSNASHKPDSVVMGFVVLVTDEMSASIQLMATLSVAA